MAELALAILDGTITHVSICRHGEVILVARVSMMITVAPRAFMIMSRFHRMLIFIPGCFSASSGRSSIGKYISD
jgi:hypothetical protein